jgi:hypothetical protein
VARRRDLRLDEEQVRAVLGGKRPKPAGGGGRGSDDGRRTGGVDLVDARATSSSRIGAE